MREGHREPAIACNDWSCCIVSILSAYCPKLYLLRVFESCIQRKDVLDPMDLSNEENTLPHALTFYVTVMSCTWIKHKHITTLEAIMIISIVLLITCVLPVQHPISNKYGDITVGSHEGY